MNSPNVINYETRPCKFVERRLLLASFARIIYTLNLQYQYIGFGGLSFTDFKLVHKELHIDNLYSIEGGDYTQSKIDINKPYSCIHILKGKSTEILSKLDILKKPSIIWLDYDDVFSIDMFHDINLIMEKVPNGSIYVMSCNRQLQDKDTEKEYNEDEFRKVFGNIVPFKLPKQFSSDRKSSDIIFKMITDYIIECLSHRDNMSFRPLYNIRYQEHKGAKMFTCGGIVLDKEHQSMNLNIDDLSFIYKSKCYNQNYQNLKNKENDEYVRRAVLSVLKQRKIDCPKFKTQKEYTDYKKQSKKLANDVKNDTIKKIDTGIIDVEVPEYFQIEIPNLTYRESLFIDQKLNDAQEEEKLINDKIILKNDLLRYKEFYKFLPNFYDVRL